MVQTRLSSQPLHRSGVCYAGTASLKADNPRSRICSRTPESPSARSQPRLDIKQPAISVAIFYKDKFPVPARLAGLNHVPCMTASLALCSIP